MKIYKWLVPLVILVFLSGCGHRKAETEGPQGRSLKAELYTTSRLKTSLFRQFPGTVEARVRAKLSSKVAGFLKEVRVEEGDRIKKGDLLVRIDDRNIRERIKALKAGILAAQKELAEVSARLDFARSDFERYRKLFKEEAVTAQEFEAKRSAYRALLARREALSARIKELRARLSEAQSLLPYTTIRAPFEGRVVHKWVDAGSYVNPGEPLLEIEDIHSGKRVVFHPEETLFPMLKPGLKIFVRFPTGGKALEVPITEVVPKVDPQTRTFTVKADLPKNLGAVSGNYVEIWVPTGQASKILVPKTALVDRGGFYGVFVADQKGILHFRVVRLGKTFYREGEAFLPVCLQGPCESYIEVLSGLQGGEKVVLNPPEGIREGDRIAGRA